MKYEIDRGGDDGGEPSLARMTAFALERLRNQRRGFFLHVEGGRIDHAHHQVNPKRALEETLEFARAVRVAREMSDPDETLIIVTADHSHTLTIGGYPTRGNPILGKVIENDASGAPKAMPELAEDGLPMTTLGYRDGRGFYELPGRGTANAIEAMPPNAGRADLSDVDTTDEGFHSEVLVPLEDESHGGEDVAIYATGPGAALIGGVMEQHEIFHVMDRAARLSKRAQRLRR